MAEPSAREDLILNALMSLQKDIGEVKALQVTAVTALADHVRDDRDMHVSLNTRIVPLEIGAAQAVGERKALRRLALGASALMSLVGSMVGMLWQKYH